MSVFWIAKRELESMFNTVVGWLILYGFLVVVGVFWVFGVGAYVELIASSVYNPLAPNEHGYALTRDLLMPFFGNCTVIILMVTPALSMRLFSEEIKSHTLELLLTSPISTLQIVLGKYLGAVGFLTIMLLCTAHIPISVFMFGDPDPGVLFGGYLALWILGSALLAMGMCVSAYTSSQVVALIVNFSAAMILYILSISNPDFTSVLFRASISAHVVDLLRGAIRSADIAYFTSFIGFFLFATHQRLESFRWR